MEEQSIDKIKTWLGAGSINLFGLPFAGKDTHGNVLAKQFGGVLISGGDILRNTHSLPHVQKIVSSGVLAPTEEYLQTVLPYFSRQEFKGKPLILSSVGRWHGEEAGVLEATAESGHPLRAVVYIKITEAELRKRHGASDRASDRGQRADDAEHILETRLKEFQEKTVPVIEFYRSQGMLIEVDGLPPITEVSAAILEGLAKHAGRTV